MAQESFHSAQDQSSKIFAEKSVFAPYLNLARHNAFLIFEEIHNKLNLDVQQLDEGKLSAALIIRELKRKKGDATLQASILRLLKRRLPWIEIMENIFQDAVLAAENPLQKNWIGKAKGAGLSDDSILDTLIQIDKELPSKKNGNSKKPEHFSQTQAFKIVEGGKEDEKIQKVTNMLRQKWTWLDEEISGNKQLALSKKVGQQLENIFNRLNTERNFQTHFHHQLPNYSEIDIQSIWENAKSRVQQNKEVNKVEDKDLANAKIRIYQDKEQEGFTEDGRILFTCLFLNHSQARYFINLFEGYKTRNTTEDKVRNAKILSLIKYCAKLPQPKLSSGDLHLDMLGELMRVPNEIFRFLAPDVQEEFVTFDDLVEIGDEQEQNKQIVHQQTTMKRYGERFPYFALRWLEEIDAFETLRFQIHIGKWLKQEDIKIYNGIEQKRLIYKEISEFGKLSDFDRELKDWKYEYKYQGEGSGKDQTVTVEHLEQHAPKYQMTGNRIGFRFMDRTTFSSRPKLYEKEKRQPDAILSTYELPNLCWYQLLYSEYQKKEGNASSKILSPEEYLYDFLLRLHQLYEDVADGNFPRFDSTEKLEGTRLKLTEEEKEGKTDRQIRKAAAATRERGIKKRRELFESHLEKRGLKMHYLPDDMRNHLLKASLQENIKEGLAQRIKDKLAETRRLFRALDRYESRLEEPNFRNQRFTAQLQSCGLPRVGDIATWLAQDMKHFKPHIIEKDEEGNIISKTGKPTNKQYRDLQSLLALYNPFKKKELRRQFRALGLTSADDNTHTHPFLNKIDLDHCNYIIDIYKKYLKERINWLKEKQEELTPVKVNKTISNKFEKYFDLDRFRQQPPKQKFKRYKNNPIQLPRGLFSESIKALLTELDAIEAAAKDNPVRLLGERMNDIAPAFYQYERIYEGQYEWDKERLRFGRIEPEEERKTNATTTNAPIPYHHTIIGKDGLQKAIDKRKEALAQIEEPPEPLSDEDYHTKSKEEQEAYREDRNKMFSKLKRWRAEARFYKIVAENEKSIRYCRHCDRVLWLMIKQLSETKDYAQEAYNLDINNLVNIGFDQSKYLEERPLLSVALHDKQITANLHLRQYGSFRRFAKDRRLESLFQFFPNQDKIRLEVLRDELKTYDEQRLRLINNILLFEKHLYEGYETDMIKFIINLNQEEKEIKYFNHTQQLRFFEEQFGSVSNTMLLSAVRNAINHNQLPLKEPKEKWLKHINSDADKAYVEANYDAYNSLFDQLTKELLEERAAKHKIHNTQREKELRQLEENQQKLAQQSSQWEHLSKKEQERIEQKEKELAAIAQRLKQSKYKTEPTIAEFWINWTANEYEKMTQVLLNALQQK